jgi:hypothetical protein
MNSQFCWEEPLQAHCWTFAPLAAAFRPESEDISARWLTATAGPVALWNATSRVGLEVGVELGREQFLVTLEPTGTDPAQSATRAYLTLCGRLLARLLVSEHVGAIGGVGVLTTPGQPVRIDGERAAGNPRLSLTLKLGVHASF